MTDHMEEMKRAYAEAILSATAPYFAWGFVFILLLLGVYFSYVNSDWQFLSRFGSLIVVTALVLAKIDLGAWLVNAPEIGSKLKELKDDLGSEFFESVEVKLKSRIRELGSDDEDHIMEAAIQKLHEIMVRERGFYSELVEKRIQKHELNIAILGTVTWGFGDLVGGLV